MAATRALAAFCPAEWRAHATQRLAACSLPPALAHEALAALTGDAAADGKAFRQLAAKLAAAAAPAKAMLGVARIPAD